MAATLSLIIPCYNEEKTLAALLQRIEDADMGAWKKEIIVVDDGSRDGSRAILESYRERPEYHIVFREHNGGMGAAIRAGVAVATGEYLIRQDADLEYDPREIRKLLEVVEKTGAPVVVGSRTLTNGWYRKGFFLVSLGARACTIWMNLLYRTRLTDAWSCYKLFSREVAEQTRFIGDGFEADYLFLGDAALKGFAIAEVPIGYAPRTRADGKKIRYRDGIRAMHLLVRHRLGLLR